VKHPDSSQLALFAGNDLGFWRASLVRRHLGNCEQCRAEADGLAAARGELQASASDLPAGLDWNGLSNEMTANIHVGLEAGQCIDGFEKRAPARPRRLGWTGAIVLASACVVMITALWLNLPEEQAKHLTGSLQRVRFERIGKLLGSSAPAFIPGSVVLEASPDSLAIRENGGTMTLLPPRGDAVTVSISMQGSAGARYVDSDTGQVTINKVYYAQ
jgi:hypothetical protein